MNSFLEDNASDRNVLFGRLLAIYDYMEEQAMSDREERGIRQMLKDIGIRLVCVQPQP